MANRMRECEQKLVKEVERLGRKRVIYHDRPCEDANYSAKTVVYLEDIKTPKGHYDPLAPCGIAFCSKKDQFSRAKGRIIATSRALKELK